MGLQELRQRIWPHPDTNSQTKTVVVAEPKPRQRRKQSKLLKLGVNVGFSALKEIPGVSVLTLVAAGVIGIANIHKKGGPKTWFREQTKEWERIKTRNGALSALAGGLVGIGIAVAAAGASEAAPIGKDLAGRATTAALLLAAITIAETQFWAEKTNYGTEDAPKRVLDVKLFATFASAAATVTIGLEHMLKESLLEGISGLAANIDDGITDMEDLLPGSHDKDNFSLKVGGAEVVDEADMDLGSGTTEIIPTEIDVNPTETPQPTAIVEPTIEPEPEYTPEPQPEPETVASAVPPVETIDDHQEVVNPEVPDQEFAQETADFYENSTAEIETLEVEVGNSQSISHLIDEVFAKHGIHVNLWEGAGPWANRDLIMANQGPEGLFSASFEHSFLHNDLQALAAFEEAGWNSLTETFDSVKLEDLVRRAESGDMDAITILHALYRYAGPAVRIKIPVSLVN